MNLPEVVRSSWIPWNRYLISGFALTILITLLFTFPLPEKAYPLTVRPLDWIAHLLATAFWTFVVLVGLARHPEIRWLPEIHPWKRWFLVPLTLFLYSALLEGLQIWIPGRELSWKDLLANLCGVLFGTGVFLRLIEGLPVPDR